MSEVAEHLAASGNDVTYVCSRFSGASSTDTIGNVKIVRIGNLWTAALHALLFYFRNRVRFDIVLQESLGGLRVPYCAPLYVKRSLVAVWYQRNDQIFRYQYNRLVGYVLRVMEFALARIHRGRLLLCPSNKSRLGLEQLGLTSSMIRVYTPGIDERVLSHSSEAMYHPRENLLAWIGKIRKYKCPHNAILTLDIVRKTVPGCSLVIAGHAEDQQYMETLRDLSNDLGLNDALSFRPRISEDEKAALLLRAKALLITSPIEGFANVASEANACGAPVVATDGIPSDVVTNNVNGFRVPFGDIEAMAEACEKILQDQETFKRLSSKGVAVAQGRNWSQTTRTFLSALKEASIPSLQGISDK